MPRLSTRRAVDSRLAVLPSTTRIVRGTTTLGSRCSQPCTFCRSCMTEGTDGTPSTIPQVHGVDRQNLLSRVADENIRTVRFLYCVHADRPPRERHQCGPRRRDSPGSRSAHVCRPAVCAPRGAPAVRHLYTRRAAVGAVPTRVFAPDDRPGSRARTSHRGGVRVRVL